MIFPNVRWFDSPLYLSVAGKAVMRRMVLMSNVAAPDLRRSGMIPTCHTYCLDLLRRLSSIHELIGIFRDLYHFLRFLITGWMTITHVTGTNMRVYTVYNSIYIYTRIHCMYIYIIDKASWVIVSCGAHLCTQCEHWSHDAEFAMRRHMYHVVA